MMSTIFSTDGPRGLPPPRTPLPCFRLRRYGRRNFWSKLFSAEKNFRGPPKSFSAGNLFDLQNFWSKKFLTPKFVRSNLCSAENKFRSKNCFGRKHRKKIRSKNSPSVSPRAEAMGGPTAIPPAELQAWILLRYPLRQIVLLSRGPNSKPRCLCAFLCAK